MTSTVVADRWGSGDAAANNQSGLLPGASTPVSQAATSTDNPSQSTGQTDSSSSWTWGSCILDFPRCVVAKVVNSLTAAMAWLANGAAGLFVWMVQPGNVSGPNGLLNKASIYELWKFIRDFFNVFFILILLLSAFATVFQVENFSIRKIFLNVLFAALVINFSFPITRFLIDLTNVPMYYFLNAILPGTDGGLAFTKVYLGSTGMSGIMLSSATEFTKAFLNLIFMFLFAISLLVLSVMFLIRLVALTLLLVLSPIGFAASLMPGFQGIGSKWWEEFWRYSFFGPSAALMLLVAMRFQNELAADGTIETFNKTFANMSSGAAAGSAMALVAFYTIPLVLIWTAIGMANKSSIAGAGLVVGLGQGAARKVGGWAKKGGIWVGTHNPVANTAKGLGKGIKDKAMDSKIAKLIKSPSKFEAGAKGFVSGKGVSAGIQSAQDKYHQEQTYEKVKKHKDEHTSRSGLIKEYQSNDADDRHAAVIAMAENGDLRTAEDLKQAIIALRSSGSAEEPKYDKFASDLVLKAIDKSKDGASAGIDPNLYAQIAHSAGGYREGDGKNGEKVAGPTLEALDSKLKKDGNLHIKVDYKIKEEIETAERNKTPITEEVARERVYKKLVVPLAAEDMIKQVGLHEKPEFEPYFRKAIEDKTFSLDRAQQILKKAQEKGKPEVEKKWQSITTKKETDEEKLAREEDEATKKQAEAVKALREKTKQRREETRQRRG